MRLPIFMVLAAAVSALAADEHPLFSGSDLKGWKSPHGTWQTVKAVSLEPSNPKALRTDAGTGVLLNSASGHTDDLFTEADHGDCELHVEFCVPKESNSGIYLQGRYEVQILDSYGKKDLTFGDCGGLYERPEKGVGFQGKAPSVNASKAPGEWQALDITFRAPRFGKDGKKTENARFLKVVLNGRTIHENVEVDGPTRSAAFPDEKARGPLMLQGDHGPVAFRNMRLKPL